MTFVLAAYVKGDDPMGHLGLEVIDSGTTSPPLPAGPDDRLHDMTMTTTLPPIATDRNNPVQYIKVDDLQDVLELETGNKNNNAWLQWISFTTKSSRLAIDCIACAGARPSLGTVPFPLNPHSDPEGFKCMFTLYKTDSPKNNCTTLKYLFPAVPTKVIPPWFVPYKGNYTCLSRPRGLNGGQEMGTLIGCNTTIAVRKKPYGITY